MSAARIEALTAALEQAQDEHDWSAWLEAMVELLRLEDEQKEKAES